MRLQAQLCLNMSSVAIVLHVLLTCAVDCAAQDPNVVRVEPGDDATLPCQAADGSIRAVEWTKQGLEGYVLFYRGGRSDPTHQDPSFKGRVQLVDSELKDGDVSLTLRNVRNNDGGTYECGVASGGSRRKRAVIDTEPIRSIRLVVTEQKEVTVKPGEDATLQCQGPGGDDITVIKWSRTDLKTDDGYVFLFRDGRSYENFQLPSYGGRVELRDPEMKNGDVSVVLKNVTVNDTGTYECFVSARSGGRSKRAAEVRSSIRLKVEASGPGLTWEGGHEEGGHEEGGHEEGGHEEGGHGVAVGLSVAAVVVLLVVGGFMFYRKRKGLTEEPSYQPADPGAGPQQV